MTVEIVGHRKQGSKSPCFATASIQAQAYFKLPNSQERGTLRNSLTLASALSWHQDTIPRLRFYLLLSAFERRRCAAAATISPYALEKRLLSTNRGRGLSSARVLPQGTASSLSRRVSLVWPGGGVQDRCPVPRNLTVSEPLEVQFLFCDLQ